MSDESVTYHPINKVKR